MKSLCLVGFTYRPQRYQYPIAESDHRHYVTNALNCLAVPRGDHEHTPASDLQK